LHLYGRGEWSHREKGRWVRRCYGGRVGGAIHEGSRPNSTSKPFPVPLISLRLWWYCCVLDMLSWHPGRRAVTIYREKMSVTTETFALIIHKCYLLCRRGLWLFKVDKFDGAVVRSRGEEHFCGMESDCTYRVQVALELHLVSPNFRAVIVDLFRNEYDTCIFLTALSYLLSWSNVQIV
jgi:hypothetical protein